MAKNYHVGCEPEGIYAGTIHKRTGEWVYRSRVTEEAIKAVMQYLLPIKNNKVNTVTATHHNGRKVRLTCEWVDDNESDMNDLE